MWVQLLVARKQQRQPTEGEGGGVAKKERQTVLPLAMGLKDPGSVQMPPRPMR